MALPPGGAAARGACISRRINSTGLVVEGIFFLFFSAVLAPSAAERQTPAAHLNNASTEWRIGTNASFEPPLFALSGAS